MWISSQISRIWELYAEAEIFQTAWSTCIDGQISILSDIVVSRCSTSMDENENLLDKSKLQTNNLSNVCVNCEGKRMEISVKFHILIHHKNNQSDVTFYVSENIGDILLSYATSHELGMRNIINNIECSSTEEIVDEFQDRFVILEIWMMVQHIYMRLIIFQRNKVHMLEFHLQWENRWINN